MKNISKLNQEDRIVLFTQTADFKGMNPSIIEKDFWVCFMLDHLFNDSKYKDVFVFKGGTSLSKSYHVIERFSEDIDLILDWRKIITDSSNPWDERSKRKQDIYNKQLNKQASIFYVNELIPALNEELSSKLGKGKWLKIDETNEMVINFNYPKNFDLDYIVPVIRLEIGPLASWTPSHITNIQPFVAEKFPNIFEYPSTNILTVDVERTFWEKITILHTIANFPIEKKLPRRYARHLYDVYCMANSNIKNLAFNRKELLEKDVIFKQKFYYAERAHYETATLSSIQLVPNENIIDDLRKDYGNMKSMIYGNYPNFDQIIECLRKLQDEIHHL